MYRKIAFTLIAAALILSAGIRPVLAQAPAAPGVQPNRVYIPIVSAGPAFQVAVNPTQMGWTSDQVFGNAPVSFNGYLYDFVPDDLFNARTPLKVLRSADGINWEYVGMPYPQDPRYNFVLGGFVYQDHLYIGLNQDNCFTDFKTIPGLVMRTANGKDWEKVFQSPVSADGFTTHASQFGVFKGMLYLTTTMEAPEIVNSQIWRSPTGDPGTWELATPVFGTLATYNSMLTEFKDYAFISSVDDTGVHIWRSADGKKWMTVGQDLLNDPAYTNWWVTNPVVFNGALYVGTNPMVFGTVSDPSAYTGGQLYRSTDGVNWQMVVKQGFGGTLYPTGIDGLIVFKNQLYALSNDLAFDGSTSTTYVWRSLTGNPGDWVKVSADGMGPNTLVGFSWEAVFNDALYIGNGFGFGAQCNLIKMMVSP